MEQKGWPGLQKAPKLTLSPPLWAVSRYLRVRSTRVSSRVHIFPALGQSLRTQAAGVITLRKSGFKSSLWGL